MSNSDPLIAAALQIARLECKQDPKGCSGPWCAAQSNIRRALEARNIEWKLPTQPEPEKHEQISQ